MVGLDYHGGLGDSWWFYDSYGCSLLASSAVVLWESYSNSVMTVKKKKNTKRESGGKQGEKENLMKDCCPNNYFLILSYLGFIHRLHLEMDIMLLWY